MRLRSLAGQRLFTWWFGFGLPPLLAGALAIAFAEHALLGGAAAAVFIAWFYETGRTTCSRCAYHGTAKCGLPGLIAPLLTEKKPAASLPLQRIEAHRRLDLWVLLFLNGLYALQPWWLPLSLVWSVGVWRIALGPKRHHGLLYRLRSRHRTGTPAVVHVWRRASPRVPAATVGLTRPTPYR